MEKKSQTLKDIKALAHNLLKNTKNARIAVAKAEISAKKANQILMARRKTE